MVDEADKAPTEVICILKGLIADGEMLLSDGRRILSSHLSSSSSSSSNIISIHSKFRLIVLANKQGYPFLGNDLLSTIGDCFSWYAIPHISINFTSSINTNFKVIIMKFS